jgi:hypothetical protein
MTGQMYVQRLEPAKVTQRYPIVMIHGTAQTGNSFIATPDGRPSWAPLAARATPESQKVIGGPPHEPSPSLVDSNAR